MVEAVLRDWQKWQIVRTHGESATIELIFRSATMETTMRARQKDGGISVNAVAGSNAVVLGLDATDNARDGLLASPCAEPIMSTRNRMARGFRIFKANGGHEAPGIGSGVTTYG